MGKEKDIGRSLPCCQNQKLTSGTESLMRWDLLLIAHAAARRFLAVSNPETIQRRGFSLLTTERTA